VQVHTLLCYLYNDKQEGLLTLTAQCSACETCILGIGGRCFRAKFYAKVSSPAIMLIPFDRYSIAIQLCCSKFLDNKTLQQTVLVPMTNVLQLFYFVTPQNIYQLLHNKGLISSIKHKFCVVVSRCGKVL